MEYFKFLREEKEELETRLSRATSQKAMEKLNKDIRLIQSRLNEPLPSISQMSARYFYFHGNILSKLEKYADVRDLYLEAVRLNPRYGNALLNLASTYFMLQEYEKALEYLNRAESDVGQTHPELKKAVLKAMEEPEAVIVLKSGEKIKGSIQSETGSKLVVKGNIEIKKDNIESIHRPETAPRTQPVIAEKKEEPKESVIEEEPVEVSPQKKTFLRRLLGQIRRRQSFYFKLNVNYLQPQDSEYKEVYGGWKIFPEIKVAYRMTEKLSFWLGYGKISGKITIPILEEEAESSQKFVSFGFGYTGKITKKFFYNIGFGLVSARYTDAAMGEEVGDTVLGFRCDGGLYFNISKLFFTDFSVRYIHAAASASNNVSVKTGGIGAGIGL